MSSRRGRKGAIRGRASRRFLGGATCKGRVFLTQTLPGLCPRIYRLEGRMGLASVFIGAMAEEALSRGLDCVALPVLAAAGYATRPWPSPRSASGSSRTSGDGTAAAGDLPLPAPRPACAPPRRTDAGPPRAEGGSPHGRRAHARWPSLSLAAAKALHDELEAVYRPIRGLHRPHRRGQPRDSSPRPRLKRHCPRRSARGAGKLPLINAPGLWYAGV